MAQFRYLSHLVCEIYLFEKGQIGSNRVNALVPWLRQCLADIYTKDQLVPAMYLAIHIILRDDI